MRAQIANGNQFIRTKMNVFSDPIYLAAHSPVTLNNVNFNYASLLGANNIEELKQSKLVIRGKTREWLTERGINTKNYSRR